MCTCHFYLFCVIVDAHTTISIGHYGNSLAVVVYMPSSLLEKETVGLLVDGCSLYSGTEVEGYLSIYILHGFYMNVCFHPVIAVIL